jgi:hypothetical protein
MAMRCELSQRGLPQCPHNLTGRHWHCGMLTLYLTQLRNSITGSVPTARVRQCCRKRNHEGGQQDECGV